METCWTVGGACAALGDGRVSSASRTRGTLAETGGLQLYVDCNPGPVPGGERIARHAAPARRRADRPVRPGAERHAVGRPARVRARPSPACAASRSRRATAAAASTARRSRSTARRPCRRSSTATAATAASRSPTPVPCRLTASGHDRARHGDAPGRRALRPPARLRRDRDEHRHLRAGADHDAQPGAGVRPGGHGGDDAGDGPLPRHAEPAPDPAARARRSGARQRRGRRGGHAGHPRGARRARRRARPHRAPRRDRRRRLLPARRARRSVAPAARRLSRPLHRPAAGLLAPAGAAHAGPRDGSAPARGSCGGGDRPALRAAARRPRPRPRQDRRAAGLRARPLAHVRDRARPRASAASAPPTASRAAPRDARSACAPASARTRSTRSPRATPRWSACASPKDGTVPL